MKVGAILILALAAAATGCAAIDTRTVMHEDLKNTRGHVIGYKEVMRDSGTGEELSQIALFVPRLNSRGEVIGYEELVRGGSVMRDLNGKRIGGRFEDLRSRGANVRNRGITIVVVSKAATRAATAEAPSLDELVRLAGLDN